MMGRGVAALTGLVFVALSVAFTLERRATVVEGATHKYWSINTLAGLTATFVMCGVVLMGRQNGSAVGIELLIVTALAAAVYLYGFRQAFKFDSGPSKCRLTAGATLYAAELIGALVLTFGSVAGLYVVAVATTLNVAFMISGAWLLVVGVYGEDVESATSLPVGVAALRSRQKG